MTLFNGLDPTAIHHLQEAWPLALGLFGIKIKLPKIKIGKFIGGLVNKASGGLLGAPGQPKPAASGGIIQQIQEGASSAVNKGVMIPILIGASIIAVVVGLAVAFSGKKKTAT